MNATCNAKLSTLMAGLIFIELKLPLWVKLFDEGGCTMTKTIQRLVMLFY